MRRASLRSGLPNRRISPSRRLPPSRRATWTSRREARQASRLRTPMVSSRSVRPFARGSNPLASSSPAHRFAATGLCATAARRDAIGRQLSRFCQVAAAKTRRRATTAFPASFVRNKRRWRPASKTPLGQIADLKNALEHILQNMKRFRNKRMRRHFLILERFLAARMIPFRAARALAAAAQENFDRGVLSTFFGISNRNKGASFCLRECGVAAIALTDGL